MCKYYATLNCKVEVSLQTEVISVQDFKYSVFVKLQLLIVIYKLLLSPYKNVS